MQYNDLVHLRHHIYGICPCDTSILFLLDKVQMKLDKYEQLLVTNPSSVSFHEAEGLILHRGKPPGEEHECSRCRQKKSHDDYKYYKCRVDKYGYLMRSNALCNDCEYETRKERESTLKAAIFENKIPPRPEPGDECPKCKRQWGTVENPRNWHRDHDAIKKEFRSWLCGDCNMANHDHRHNIS